MTHIAHNTFFMQPPSTNPLYLFYSETMNNSIIESEVLTMYYTQEQIDRANQADLVLFLQSQGEPLERAGQEYRWKRHDSLTVRGNKWYRHSQSKGGGPVDFVMEFFGKSFTEAVELLTGEKGAVSPPDRPCPASLSDFRLPPPNNDNMILSRLVDTFFSRISLTMQPPPKSHSTACVLPWE